MRVAIVGGTGNFGPALAVRLRDAGFEVVIGSRDAEKGRTVAAELGVEGSANEDAVRGADLVVLAVRAEAAVDTARGLRAAIGTTPVLSVAAELSFGADGVKPTPEATSVAQRVADVLDAPVAAGLHSLAAASLRDSPPDEDALVVSDDAVAKERALELAAAIVSGRALDAGPLACARALEGMTAVIVNLNRRYKGHAGVHVTGLP